MLNLANSEVVSKKFLSEEQLSEDYYSFLTSLVLDVQVKLELLDNKHVQDVATQLQKLSQGLADFYDEMHRLGEENENLFPVEVDLADSAFLYDGNFEVLPPDENNEETEEPIYTEPDEELLQLE